MPGVGKAYLKRLVWVISFLSAGYVVWHLCRAPEQFREVSGTQFLFALALVVVLASLQLCVETDKWRRLLRFRSVNISFFDAFVAVLAGFAAGSITPNRIGEYAGRMLVTGSGHGATIVSQTVLDRVAQSVPTWLAGIWLGWALLGTAELRISIFLGVILAALLVLVGAWFLGDGLPRVLQAKVFLRMVATDLKASPAQAWLMSIAWSCIRYMVFILQFHLLARAAGIEAPFTDIAAFIATVYWLKSLMPFIGFSELGVRESIALSLANQYGWPATPIVLATFSVYAVNNLIPTLAGSWLIRKYV